MKRMAFLRRSPRAETSSITPRSIVSFLICAAMLAGIFLLPGGRTAYAIYDGGETRTVYSDENSIDDVLTEAGVDLGAGVDYVTEKNGDSVIVTILRASSLTIECDGTVRSVTSEGPTVADVLSGAGIALGEGDTVNFEPGSGIFDGMALVVTRAKDKLPQILARAVSDTDEHPLSVQSGLTADGMSDPLASADLYDEPSPEEAAAAAREKAAEEKLAAEKSIMNDKTKSLKARAEAAKSVSGSTAELKMAQVPLKDESGTAVDSDGNTLSYTKTLKMRATAYTLASSPNDTTASGVVPYVGTVAVDLSVLPLGTRVYVTSADGSWVYGYSVVEDTGVRGNTIDLYLDTYDECINFGVRSCIVYVLS